MVVLTELTTACKNATDRLNAASVAWARQNCVTSITQNPRTSPQEGSGELRLTYPTRNEEILSSHGVPPRFGKPTRAPNTNSPPSQLLSMYSLTV